MPGSAPGPTLDIEYGKAFTFFIRLSFWSYSELFRQKSHILIFNLPHLHLAHVCCGQMAGWIKMPLGTEV